LAHPEIELLSNIVSQGDFTAVRKAGLTPEHFQTEEGKLVFDWVWRQFHDPKHPGEIPDQQRLKRHFPNFEFRPTRNSIAAIIHDILATRLKVEVNKVSSEMTDLLAEGEDPFAVLSAYLPHLRDLNAQGDQNEGLLLSHSAASLKQEYETKKLAGGITGIPIPWSPLNEALCGLQPGMFFVIYGRNKNMKSWVALAMAMHAYNCNRRVLVYSREMSKEDMLRRASSILCGVDYELLRRAKLPTSKEVEFFSLMEQLGELENEAQSGARKRSMLFIGDNGPQGGTVDNLTAAAEKFEADLVIADGFYLMRDSRTNLRSADWKQIAHISQDIKRMAQYLKIPVIGTTQANRAASKTQGDDTDELSFSDTIGADADLLMRCFKGKGPTPGVPAVLFTFPAARETGLLNPFVINALPGADFSLLQTSVDVTAFLKDKKKQDAEEETKQGGKGTEKKPAPKPVRRTAMFRQ
jgi:replicative DNA helicase